MSKPVILTGLRANNELHIGNYLGALLPIIDMAKEKAGEYQINLFVPDLHSFTTPIDHSQLQAQIMRNVRMYLAAGLPSDHTDILLYRQSYIPAHSELTVILNNFAQFGELFRMTQFKEKSTKAHDELMEHFSALENTLLEISAKYDINSSFNSPADRLIKLSKILRETGKVEISNEIQEITNEILKDMIRSSKKRIELHNEIKELKAPVNVSNGLFTYPVLMAADILLYNTTYVPVGDDQTQHLEFTRDIAQRMNSKFGELFTVPLEVKKQHEFFGKDQGLRIRDLQEPTRKMSKSDETGKGVIFLSDDQASARKKIMSATTDSLGSIQYNYQEQPGISNLLDLYQLFGGNKDEFIGQKQYGPLKQAVADKVCGFLASFQDRYNATTEEQALRILQRSEAVASDQASQTLVKVQKAVGLRA